MMVKAGCAENHRSILVDMEMVVLMIDSNDVPDHGECPIMVEHLIPWKYGS